MEPLFWLLAGFAFSFSVFQLFAAIVHRLSVRVIRASPQALRGKSRVLAAGAAVLGGVILAISILLTGSLVFGLVGLIFVPGILKVIAEIFRARRTRELDRAAIVFLHALRGLIHAGVGLPFALFHLSRTITNPFTDSLNMRLQDFEHGRSLELCLSRFRSRAGMRTTGIGLQILEVAYREGLALLPFLDRMLPVLEAEADTVERTRSLRKSVLAQATLAALLPWAVGSFLWLYQPDLIRGFCRMPYFFTAMASVGAWEIFGVMMIWRASNFY